MLSLDHIVISGKNLLAASKKHEDILTIKGGEHQNWGTHNYLGYFANGSYLEWLGINNKTVAHQSDNPLIQHLVYLLDAGREEVFQFALQADIDTFVAHFEKAKINYVGPLAGRRTKPDGETLTWRMLFPTYDFTKETLPFLIEWNQSEAERIDASIVNNKRIKVIHFGGTTIERFAQIYQLNQGENNKLILENVEIIFNKTEKFHFEIE
ncbi:VOC family protein [Pseudogracilibacillus sp. SO30301A]|uniref:VOC family protein n=1 Tax=Pseudogracilibacillus sp. SO30301A TaxID=3098291 RepID=UPI00300DD951